LFGKRSLFGTISIRDKLLIFITIIVLVVFIIYQFVALPLSEKKRGLITEEQKYREELKRLREVGGQFVEYKHKYDSLKNMLEKKKGNSVLTYLDNMSQSAGIRENIDYIKPSGTVEDKNLIKNIVEIKVDAVVVNDLVKFMNKIENGRDGLLVYSIRLKPFFKDRSKTDAIVRIIDIDIKN